MLDEKTKAMIREALNDEYKTRAFYQLVIKTFGPVRPFINIVLAEDTHAKALEALCARYGIPLPADEWDRTLQPPASVLEACRAGVEGEVENIAMYDRFLKSTEISDIRSLFQRLQARSRMLISPRSNAVWHEVRQRGMCGVKARLLPEGEELMPVRHDSEVEGGSRDVIAQKRWRDVCRHQNAAVRESASTVGRGDRRHAGRTGSKWLLHRTIFNR